MYTVICGHAYFFIIIYVYTSVYMQSFTRIKYYYLLTIVLLSLLHNAQAAYVCSTMDTHSVTRGNSITLSWQVQNASNCTGGFDADGGVAYPNTSGDGIYSSWIGSLRSGSGSTNFGGANVLAAPGVYTFSCTDIVSTVTGCSQLTVNDCGSGTAWNGSACVANPTGTLTSSSPSCTIPTGGTGCTVNLTWSTNNPVGTSAVTNNRNASQLTGNSGSNQSVTVSGGAVNTTYYLYNNGLELDSVTVTPSCASGTSWNGSSCQPTVIRGSISGSPNPCTIGTNQSTCTATLNWNVDNPVAPTSAVMIDGSTFAGGNSGAQAAPWITARGGVFSLVHNGSTVNTVNVYGVCASGNYYHAGSTECKACDNGGCTGTGGSYANP
ncbi:MAG: hypothetical protein RI935_750, partial [Candidatus Parcubacteria bacterium]